ncbi:hypothetical protein ACFQY7_50210 [Actinomadura luteofluorescens]|uniref:hypothetical protein n=1 Tax=Actinomadura luteofluorescens TaxID=46163 RepID=UPI00363DEB9B
MLVENRSSKQRRTVIVEVANQPPSGAVPDVRSTSRTPSPAVETPVTRMTSTPSRSAARCPMSRAGRTRES